MTSRRRQWLRILAAAAGLGVLSMAIPAIRTPILRAMGQALVADDSPAPADMIVVATGADGAGVLEAADLVQSGVSTRVAVFADPPDAVVDREFVRRGVPYDDWAARSIQQLNGLGVKTVEVIPRAVAGTDDESRVLPEWCDQRRLGSVLVVTTSDHSRRLRRVLRRSMGGRPTRVIVRSARFSPFDPDRWWQSPDTRRIGVIELQKLLLDLLRHPF